MAKVGRKNTKPELAVRSAAHAMGFRFKLHGHDLPGQPDVVSPKHRIALFVHGCFGIAIQNAAAMNRAFWLVKFERNVARDAEAAAMLRLQGWEIQVIWECQTRDSLQLHLWASSMLSTERSEL
jgi:DNA mismatch endonuclease (patch repair protein)